MTKYFFDLVGRDCAQYDYQGRVFSVPEQAFRMAELMALDLEMNGDGYRLNERMRHSRRTSSETPTDHPTRA